MWVLGQGYRQRPTFYVDMYFKVINQANKFLNRICPILFSEKHFLTDMEANLQVEVLAT